MVLEQSPHSSHNQYGNPDVDSKPDVFQCFYLPKDKGPVTVPYTSHRRYSVGRLALAVSHDHYTNHTT